jgi:predicted phosphodiesterase
MKQMKIRLLLIFTVLLLISGCASQPTGVPPSATAAPGLTSTAPGITATVLPGPTTTLIPAPPGEVTFQKGPYLVPGTDAATMNVLWQADSAASYWVEVGTDTSFSLGKVTPGPATSDGLVKAVLTGLQPATHYLYRVTDGKQQAEGSFNTSPAASEPFSFWVYGDSRSGQGTQNAITGDILSDIQAHPADQSFVLFSGDLMDQADEQNLQSNQFDPLYPSTRQMMSEMPMLNAMGNHDGTQLFIKYFPYPFAGHFYWSFTYGSVHVAVVDEYVDVSAGSQQWIWLQQDLAASTQPWKFILLHEPGWSAGPHDDSEVVRQIVQNIAVHQHVAIVFAGHNHYYARAEVDGVIHITAGGGGAPLYDPQPGSPNVVVAKKSYNYLKVDVTSSTLSVTALTPDNQVIDSFTVNP